MNQRLVSSSRFEEEEGLSDAVCRSHWWSLVQFYWIFGRGINDQVSAEPLNLEIKNNYIFTFIYYNGKLEKLEKLENQHSSDRHASFINLESK